VLPCPDVFPILHFLFLEDGVNAALAIDPEDRETRFVHLLGLFQSSGEVLGPRSVRRNAVWQEAVNDKTLSKMPRVNMLTMPMRDAYPTKKGFLYSGVFLSYRRRDLRILGTAN
jgi:hypothetical protein